MKNKSRYYPKYKPVYQSKINILETQKVLWFSKKKWSFLDNVKLSYPTKKEAFLGVKKTTSFKIKINPFFYNKIESTFNKPKKFNLRQNYKNN
jgi:hypothetical protein